MPADERLDLRGELRERARRKRGAEAGLGQQVCPELFAALLRQVQVAGECIGVVGLRREQELKRRRLRKAVVDVVKRRLVDVHLVLPACAALEIRDAALVDVRTVLRLQLQPDGVAPGGGEIGLGVDAVLEFVHHCAVGQKAQRVERVLEAVALRIACLREKAVEIRPGEKLHAHRVRFGGLHAAAAELEREAVVRDQVGVERVTGENAILLAENNASAHQVNRHLSGRQLNHSKSSVSFQERTVAADNEVMFAAEVEMPEQSVNAEVNGRELSVLQMQNEDSERQMAVSSNHATKPLEADGGQKLYAGRAQDGHFERSYKDKYEQNWTMNLYAENVSLGSGSDGMSNGMYASSDPLAGGGFADHGVFLAAVSPLRYAIPKYVEAKHHAPLAIGAQVGIGLAPRLSLSTGVVYTRVASDFKSYGVSEFDTHQVLHYVGVPLGLNYEVWSTGGFHAYVMAGGEADFNVKNDTKVSGHKEDVKRDGVQFSGKASLGAQYDVTPQVGFYIEPGAKYYFDNGSEIENTFKDKKWNFNLQFGLRINLK